MKNYKIKSEENKQESGMFKRNAIVLASLIGTAGMIQAAECAGVVNYYATSSTTCDVSGNNYNYIQGHGAGTVITVAASTTTVNATGSASYATGVDSGALIIFEGNLNSTANGNRISVSVGYPMTGYAQGYAEMKVKGNLTTTSTGNGEAVYLLNGGKLTVEGNLIATRGNPYVDRDVIRGYGSLTVNGTTTVNSAVSNGIFTSGINFFDGAATIDISGADRTGLILVADTQTQFKDNLTVNTTGVNSIAILNNSSNNIGTTTVDGTLLVTTTGSSSTGITNNSGTFSGTGTSNTIKTTGANSYGLYATGGAIGLGTTAPTTATGATILLESGTVTTSGAGAHGVYANNATGNITITEGAAGVIKATGPINPAGTGTIPDGIEVLNNGTGNTTVTTAGAITATGVGINIINNSAGNTTVTQTAGTITAGEGISVLNNSPGVTTINTAGDQL